MQTQITVRNFEASDNLRDYATERLAKLKRYYDGITDARIAEEEAKIALSTTIFAPSPGVEQALAGSPLEEAYTGDEGTLVWDLGAVKPSEERTVELTVDRPQHLSGRTCAVDCENLRFFGSPYPAVLGCFMMFNPFSVPG